MSKKLFVSFIVSILSIASVQPMTRFERKPGRKLLQISSLLPHLSQKDINTVASGGVKGSPVRHMTYQEVFHKLGLAPEGDSLTLERVNENFQKILSSADVNDVEQLHLARKLLIQNLLVNAISNNDLEEVKSLIRGGAYINISSDNGTTPLIWAVMNNTESGDIVKLLLDEGADVNAQRVSDGYTALMYAVKLVQSRQEDRAKIVEMLLKAGADVNIQNKRGKTALDFARNLGDDREKIEKLLHTSRVLPHLSQGVENTSAVGALRPMTYDEARYTLGFTPMVGVKNLKKFNEDFQKVLSSADVNDVEQLHQARKILIQNLFMNAISDNDLEEVKLLINAGVDINATNDHGVTPLLFAVVYNAESGDMVKLLLENGADVNAQSVSDGYTALMHAVKLVDFRQENRAKIVEMLLKAGADVNIQNKRGKTALDFARNLDYDREKIEKLLLEASKRVVE